MYPKKMQALLTIVEGLDTVCWFLGDFFVIFLYIWQMFYLISFGGMFFEGEFRLCGVSTFVSGQKYERTPASAEKKNSPFGAFCPKM